MAKSQGEFSSPAPLGFSKLAGLSGFEAAVIEGAIRATNRPEGRSTWKPAYLPLAGMALVHMLGCAGANRPAAAPPPATATLEAPKQISPRDGVVLHGFPRTITFQWMAVPGAAGYTIEIDCFHCCAVDKWCTEARGTGYVVPGLKEPTYTFNFWGDQSGRWRVWAVGASSENGGRSGWWGFSWVSKPESPGGVSPAQTPPSGSVPQVGADKIYRIGDGVVPPKAVYSPTPTYTDAGARDKINGEVLVEVVVGADGAVQDARVVRSLRHDLDEKAVETVKMWRFEPGRKDGKAVATRVTVEFTFHTGKPAL